MRGTPTMRCAALACGKPSKRPLCAKHFRTIDVSDRNLADRRVLRRAVEEIAVREGYVTRQRIEANITHREGDEL